MNHRLGDACRRLGFAGGRLAIVALGVVVSQFILYGPSLAGRKVLLPLDILSQANIYSPLTPGRWPPFPHNHGRSDVIYAVEPARQFAACELRAGRWPSWDPYQFAGVPTMTPRFSAFWRLACISPSPAALPWIEMLVALIAAFGMYAFCRRVLRVGCWPAVFVAWCYPLTGFFIFWQGWGLHFGLAWLPWMLLAVDKTVRRANRGAAPCLALLTGLLTADGRPDIAAFVLLISGLYAVWCFFDEYGSRCFSRRALWPLACTATAWGLGILLGAGQLLPMFDYAATGARLARRGAGEENRPPVGIAALPQIVLPDMYGSMQRGSIPLFEFRDGVVIPYPLRQANQLESTAATYVGLLAALLLAPLAWCSRRRRSMNLFWLGLAVLGLGWNLNIPGLVALGRLPLVNILPYNRFVFAASLALLAMAAVGLDVLADGNPQPRWWFWGPMAASATLLGWCLYRAATPPEPVATLLESYVARFGTFYTVADLAGVHRVQRTFMHNYAIAALLSALTLAGWALVRRRAPRSAWPVPLLGLLMLADLLWFGYGRSAQCDWSLYYPRIPVLEDVAKDAEKTSSRIIGAGCLPSVLSKTLRLRDVRGYDGVDPARMIDLMMLAADPKSPFPREARTQAMTPKMEMLPPDAVRLPPILDMLAVRYVIFRGSPPADKGVRGHFSGDDYWVLINRSALPRVFVPERVETIADDHQRLHKMAAADFHPQQVAYVETPLDLPTRCRGSAKIVAEVPTRITVALQMHTPGLVVLSDRWDKGWAAYLDGRKTPILRTNHAVRGVLAPPGESTLEFRYEPASVAWGMRLSGLSLLAILAWAGGACLRRRGPKHSP